MKTKGERTMLKKILGEAPFDAFLSEEIVLSPDKKCKAEMTFSNISEYDLPLSCNIRMNSFAKIDKAEFDIILPADGNTSEILAFSVPTDSRIYGGIKVCELEILDRIFDSKTLYEIEFAVESAYKCVDKKEDAFCPSQDMLFTRNGMFYGNRSECVCLEVPSLEEAELELHVISGKIKGFKDSDVVKLEKGMNRLCFEMEDDGSFEFRNLQNGGKIYPDTINPEYFI